MLLQHSRFVSLEQVSQFLYQEARFLDDEQWDDWLACYAPLHRFGCACMG